MEFEDLTIVKGGKQKSSPIFDSIMNDHYDKNVISQQDQYVDNQSTMGSRLVTGSHTVDSMNAMKDSQALVDVSLDFIPGFGAMRTPSRLAKTSATKRTPRDFNDQFKNDYLTGDKASSRYTKSLEGVDFRGMTPSRPSAFDTVVSNLGDAGSAMDKKQRYDALQKWGPIKDKDGFAQDWYHGSTNITDKFAASKVGKDHKINPENNWGDWSWHSPSARYTEPYTINHLGKEIVNPNTHKTNINAKNVFDPDKAEDMAELEKFFKNSPGKDKFDPADLMNMAHGVKDKANGWQASEMPIMKQFLEAKGYDGQYLYHQGVKNIMVKNPNAIKSVNNRGTYDKSSDTMKALIPGSAIVGVAANREGEY